MRSRDGIINTRKAIGPEHVVVSAETFVTFSSARPRPRALPAAGADCRAFCATLSTFTHNKHYYNTEGLKSNNANI